MRQGSGSGSGQAKMDSGKRAINHYQEIRSVQKQFGHENVELFQNFFLTSSDFQIDFQFLWEIMFVSGSILGCSEIVANL